MWNKKIGAVCLAAVMTLTPIPASSQDWLRDFFDESCDPSVVDTLSQDIRNNIEAQVKRGEASIRPPAAIGDLSCLNDLMTAPLDIFSNIGGLLGSLTGGLGGALDIGDGISRQICQFAAKKWGEVTKPLTGAMGGLNGLTIPSLSSAFDSIGSSSNNSSSAPPFEPIGQDPDGPGGANEETTPPNEIVFDEEGYNAAMKAYNKREQEIIADHLTCEIARQTYRPYSEADGWGGWSGWNGSYIRPTLAQCQAILNELDGMPPSVDDYTYEIQAAAPPSPGPQTNSFGGGSNSQGSGSNNGGGDILDDIWGTMGR